MSNPVSEQAPVEPPVAGTRLTGTLLAAVLSSVAAGFLVTRLLNVLAPQWASNTDRLAIAVVAVVYASITASILVGMGSRVRRRHHWLGLTPIHRQPVAVGFVVWSGAYLVAAGIYALASPLGLTPQDAGEVLLGVGSDNGRLAGASPLLLVLILARILLLAPLAEELLFRGALFGWLRARLSARTTITLTAAGFTLIHQAPAMLPLALVVGIAAGIIRERTGSTSIPVVLHAVQNAIVVAVAGLVTGWQATFM